MMGVHPKLLLDASKISNRVETPVWKQPCVSHAAESISLRVRYFGTGEGIDKNSMPRETEPWWGSTSLSDIRHI